MSGIRDLVNRGVKAVKARRPKPPLPEKVILGLGERQMFPKGDDLAPDFLAGPSRGLMDKATPIASIGSCFAREIKDYLTEAGFNYVQTATGPNARHGSAAWDRVYNTFSLRQEFERALGTFAPKERLWELADGRVVDPYRKDVVWDSMAEAEAGLEEHRRTAREALMQARILFVTIGLTEIWYSREDGSVFFQVPPAEVYDEAKHAFRASTFAENLENLRVMHRLLSEANPDCTMVVTVSPVPLRATFRDENVVSANTQSKSTLLAAAREFTDSTEGVFYFPSYELVTAVIDRPFEEDNRHVKRSTVREIMRVFEANFLT